MSFCAQPSGLEAPSQAGCIDAAAARTAQRNKARLPCSQSSASVRDENGWLGVKSSPRQHISAEISVCLCSGEGFPPGHFETLVKSAAPSLA